MAILGLWIGASHPPCPSFAQTPPESRGDAPAQTESVDQPRRTPRHPGAAAAGEASAVSDETRAALESIEAEARARAAQLAETRRAKARAERQAGGRPFPPGVSFNRDPNDPRSQASRLAQARWDAIHRAASQHQNAAQRAAAARRAQLQRMLSTRRASAGFLNPVLSRP
jgi:hypothetical protein